jgi:general secretion pathway protein F
MGTFYYKAVSAEGELQTGELVAADLSEAIEKIHKIGCIPIEAAERSGFSRRILSLLNIRAGAKRGSRIKLEELVLQLASLMDAEIPLDEALVLLMASEPDPFLQGLLSRLQEELRGGASFTGAAQNLDGAFTPFDLSMLRTAESSGRLALGLVSLGDYLRRTRETRERIISALIYPAILLAVSMLSLMAILTFVIPQFSELFDDMGRALPVSTQIVLALTAFLRDWGWALLAAALVLSALIRMALQRPEYRLWFDTRVLGIPAVGSFILRAEMERFCRSFGTLLESGMPLLEAIEIARGTLINVRLSNAVEAATLEIREGSGLAEALTRAAPFPRLGLQLMQVGERTGRLDALLVKAADTYEQQLTVALQRGLSMLEPLLIVGLGVMIAGIIISVLVGIMSVNELPL